MHLSDIGWDSYFEEHFYDYQAAGLVPGRVAREEKISYEVLTEQGPLVAHVSGKFRHETPDTAAWPAVGDWVAIKCHPGESVGTINGVLARRSCFIRKEAGSKTIAQVSAANVDAVFIVCGLDNDFSIRRIERYLSAAWESGAVPILVLNKADLCPDLDIVKAQLADIVTGVAVHVVSAQQRQGIDELRAYLTCGKTIALLGSSGVGKSSIINALLGEERAATGSVREDDSRGRHTTTHRELILCPTGGVLLDTPGMRELQLWGDEQTLTETFEDIIELARLCRFRDCRHQAEPGCAVQQALQDGALMPDRFESFLKLGREQQRLAQRQMEKERLMGRVAMHRRREHLPKQRKEWE